MTEVTWYGSPARPAANGAAAGRAAEDRGGKASRFKALALPHLDEVYTLARYLLRHEADAEDAVQECYLRAYRYFDGFTGTAAKPWLFQILRNVCHAHLARNRGLVFGDRPGVDEGSAGIRPLWGEDGESPEAAAIRSCEATTLSALIDALPEPLREVLVLREVNDLPYREIAAVVDAPIGTVMSRLARARTMLREAWTAADGEKP